MITEKGKRENYKTLSTDAERHWAISIRGRQLVLFYMGREWYTVGCRVHTCSVDNYEKVSEKREMLLIQEEIWLERKASIILMVRCSNLAHKEQINQVPFSVWYVRHRMNNWARKTSKRQPNCKWRGEGTCYDRQHDCMSESPWKYSETQLHMDWIK